jgi:FkbH-like protein
MRSELTQEMQQLARREATLAEIMKSVEALDLLETATPTLKTAKFGVSANITADLSTLFFKKQGYLQQRKIEVVQGSLNSHFENIENFQQQGVEYCLVLNFFDNLIPSLEARLPILEKDFLEQLKEKVQGELHLLFEKCQSFKTVFVTLFHQFSRSSSYEGDTPIENCLYEFNQSIKKEAALYGNIKILDPASIVSTLGRGSVFNERFYYKFMAPYAAAFWDHLAKEIFLQLRGIDRYFYKALVLDCDGTLWGGIIGEDHLEGIALGSESYPGNIYWYVQNEILNLQKQGILLVLCSKNNLQDVEQVLTDHKQMVIKDHHIILKKVNWQDKVSNLKEIASELNIGLDSLIFLDDSAFECNSVRSQLPEVHTVQVPKNIFEYPQVIHHIRELVLASGNASAKGTEGSHGTQSVQDKTEQYRIRNLAKQEEAKFSNHEDYLKSLNLKVVLKKNCLSEVSRISELTLKSNQFNLTTRRYSEQEILSLMKSEDGAVYSISVSDRFGDSGLTGVAILRENGEDVFVDSFLMSCRVIGRGIEFSVWESLLKKSMEDGRARLNALYIKSAKNAQVSEYFEKVGLGVVDQTENVKNYSCLLSEFPKLKQRSENYQNYIEVNCDF